MGLFSSRLSRFLSAWFFILKLSRMQFQKYRGVKLLFSVWIRMRPAKNSKLFKTVYFCFKLFQVFWRCASSYRLWVVIEYEVDVTRSTTHTVSFEKGIILTPHCHFRLAILAHMVKSFAENWFTSWYHSTLSILLNQSDWYNPCHKGGSMNLGSSRYWILSLMSMPQ